MDLADNSRCPLCGGGNECQLCTSDAYKGPCWCARVEIPEQLLAQVPEDSRNRVCICRNCVTQFHRNKPIKDPPPQPLPGDYYFDAGLLVFTAAYHIRRGYCCGSGCRHCPYA